MKMFEIKHWFRDSLLAVLFLFLVKNIFLDTRQIPIQDTEIDLKTSPAPQVKKGNLTIEQKISSGEEIELDEEILKQELLTLKTQINSILKISNESINLNKELENLLESLKKIESEITRSEQKANMTLVLGPLASAAKFLDDRKVTKEILEIATKTVINLNSRLKNSDKVPNFSTIQEALNYTNDQLQKLTKSS